MNLPNCKQCNKEIDLLGYFNNFDTCLKCTNKNFKKFQEGRL